MDKSKEIGDFCLVGNSDLDHHLREGDLSDFPSVFHLNVGDLSRNFFLEEVSTSLVRLRDVKSTEPEGIRDIFVPFVEELFDPFSLTVEGVGDNAFNERLHLCSLEENIKKLFILGDSGSRPIHASWRESEISGISAVIATFEHHRIGN